MPEAAVAVTFWQTSSTESRHSHLYSRHQATLRMARTEHSNHWDTDQCICELSIHRLFFIKTWPIQKE